MPRNTASAIESASRLVRATATVLLTPWRPIDVAAQAGRQTFVLALAVANTLLAAALAVLLSNWIYLAGKGWRLGWGQMDLGDDDLPSLTIGQLFLGFTLSMLTWVALLTLTAGVPILVARRVYRGAYAQARAAGDRALLMTCWFVVWAVGFLVATSFRHGEIVMPSRWPEGETLEARERLLWLLPVFVTFWAAGLPPTRPEARGGRVRAAVCGMILCGLVWVVLWRCLPWVAMESFTG